MTRTLKTLQGRFMGKEFSFQTRFLKLKHREWTSFVSHFSRWEKERAAEAEHARCRGGGSEPPAFSSRR
jgi:hypothetical protein